MTSTTLTPAVIYLRLSDFRDEDDETFEARRAELEEFAASLGLRVVWVAIENDLNGDGKPRGASAYKTPIKVRTPSGLIEMRTNRPTWTTVIRDYLLTGQARVLLVSDDSRLTRNERDGLDLIDAARESGASVVAPDDNWEPRWILTSGGTDQEREALRDRINDARRYSADLAAKVRRGRRRWAGRSYQGGRRPYGYRVDTTTTQHQRNLIVNDGTEGWPDEAAVIRQAATDIRDRGISLKAVARDLRERGEPTVTGTAWSSKTLRDVLIKPAAAGLAIYRGELREAPWEPILDRDAWERLRDLLTDPSRRTNTGRANEPRWLLSGFAACGVCGGRTRVAGGKNRAPAYVGAECCHVRRNAAAVDRLITDLIVGEDPAQVSPGRERVLGRLEEDDAKDLLRPEPRVHPDGEALRAERARLRKGRRSLMETFGQEDGDADAAATIRKWDKRLAGIEAQLAVSDQPDPLPEFRTGEPARAVWESLPLPRRRAIVQVLLDSIVIRRAGRKGSAFDPETIKVRWVEEVRTEAPAR